MKRKIRVIQYGIGAVGKGITRLLLEKENIEIVGAIDVNREIVGKDLGQVVGMERRLGVKVSDDPENVFSNTRADIALYATSSLLEELYPQIAYAIKSGVDVISTCEQLAYPYYRNPKLANKIDKEAKKYGVTVLGTGSLPGFIWDTFIITLTGICTNIKRIKASRVGNWSRQGVTVMKHIGAGQKLTVEEFNSKVADGSLILLIALPDSMNMVADAIGWKLDEIKQTYEPIFASKDRETPIIKVKAGTISGFKQTCYGIKDGDAVITYSYIGDIYPEMDGLKVSDNIFIEGTPNIDLVIRGGVNTTMVVAMAVNMIPHAINAKHGLVTMKDLPTPRALLGDLRLPRVCMKRAKM